MVMKIGFVGQMRSGKDTAASYFCKKYFGKIMKFADPLYEIQAFAQKVTGFPEEKDRPLLQWLGTEWGRKKDPDIWIKVFLQRLRRITDLSIYVTDARFANEVELLKKKGFKIVLIWAKDDIRIARGATHENHESEQFAKTYDGWDYKIENSGTEKEFFIKLDYLEKEIKKKECLEVGVK